MRPGDPHPLQGSENFVETTPFALVDPPVGARAVDEQHSKQNARARGPSPIEVERRFEGLDRDPRGPIVARDHELCNASERVMHARALGASRTGRTCRMIVDAEQLEREADLHDHTVADALLRVDVTRHAMRRDQGAKLLDTSIGGIVVAASVIE